MKVTKTKFSTLLINWYFAIAIFIYLFTMLFSFVRPGVIMSGVLLIILLCLILNNRFRKISKLDLSIICYALYCLLSFLWNTVEGYSINIYFQEVTVSIFPIVIYFSAKNCDKEQVGYNALKAIIICSIIGCVLYILLPQNYCQYLYNMGFSASANSWNCRQGFNSFIGRTAMGSYSVMGMALAVHFYKNGIMKKNHAIISFYFLFIICLLTSQRSACFGGVVLFIYFTYLLLKKINAKIIILFLIGIILITLGLVYAKKMNLFEFLQLTSKINKMGNAFGERTKYWLTAIKSVNFLILGDGLGSAGHRMVGISSTYITDGNFAKMLVEIGVIGCILFCCMLYFYLKKNMRNIRLNGLSLFMVIFILVQATGSNVLSTQIIAPILWLFLGWEECEK